ncbi:hypothetical protein HPP92_008331 [Vanilla planifolia]|uniref:Poor homologous synapsis 1 PH domain-containing protein n=1 Tax=Vanilla planifolia TaxID=51239 RepID=A0A835V3N9_VANPL|nr:hypothetical protein HPP92_008331 [Vanilla planifolia]
MAEAAGFTAIPPLASRPAPIPPAVREQWEAEFSRFFIFPRRCSSPKAVLRPLSGIMFRHGRGTWLTASSPATILICKATSDAAAVLSVCVSGYVYEEHLLLNLQLSWPQVACVPQCPIRGSRAVFMSFCDRFSQVQKFALRFPTSAVAETFFNFVKEKQKVLV